MHKNYTIRDIREGLVKGEFSAEEIFNHYIGRINLENHELNAYLSVFNFPDGFRSQNLKIPSLYGVPVAVKDNILIDGEVATAGSKILKNYVSSYDATVIKRLKNAGSLFLGKTNMDEFAMGSSTENSAFGPTRNPRDKNRVPGGSSGGSAAAVAADMAVFALGSDTGGSIRQPASFCGVVGLKPTYGRVSRHGVVALASSLDQIGPLTKNAYDSALVMNIISGRDVFDSTTISGMVPDFTEEIDKPIKGLRIGVPKEYFGRGLDPEVKGRMNTAISALEDMGCVFEEISLPHSEHALAVYYVVMPCEASSNLSRFDGIRYGHSAKQAKTLLDVYMESRDEGFGPEPKRRIILGTYALSSGYYDAYYIKAQEVRSLIKKDFDDAFRKVDLIIGPTSPTTAFKIGEKSADPLEMYLSDIYTVPVNLAGLPAISVPCGNGSKSGLPVGLQIIGNSFCEHTLIRAAHQLENKINV